MSCLLGIDLGTSSVKVVVFAVEGALKGVGMAESTIHTPRLGYAEQDPGQWWRATIIAVREAVEKAGRPEILGIGFSGQMHGLVFHQPLMDAELRLHTFCHAMVSFGGDVVCGHGADLSLGS